MKKYKIGIDSGSAMCKAALIVDNKIKFLKMIPSGWNPIKTAKDIVEYICLENNILIDECFIVTTGYGRENIDFRDKSLTEITAHGKGGMFLNKNISGIIDIGGQDSKVIKISNGKVLSFLMNDKCAAGTGRFLEMSCNTLEIPLKNIDFVLKNDDFVPINSMCAVFAESELIGLRSSGVAREKIINGVIRSIASRTLNMLNKIQANQKDVFLMTGGLSQSKHIVKTLCNITGYNILTHENSPMAGAIGAAISI